MIAPGELNCIPQCGEATQATSVAPGMDLTKKYWKLVIHRPSIAECITDRRQCSYGLMKAGRQASCWRRHSSMCSGCLAATYILAIEKTVIVISVHVAPIRRGRGALKRHPPEARSSRTKSHTLTEMDAIDSAICEPGRAWLPCHHHQLRLVTNRMLSRSASVCRLFPSHRFPASRWC